MKFTGVIFWLPRVLAVAVIAFISIFALDVFQPDQSAFAIALALFMHLIPSFVLTGALILSWKNEKIGGVIFITLAIFLFTFWKHWFAQFVLIPWIGLVGILFVWNGLRIVKGGYER